MNATSFLVQLRPRSFRRWRALPVFGAQLERFVRWLHSQGYTTGSIRNYMKALPRVVRCLRRKGVTSLAQLTQQELQAVHSYYRPRNPDLSGVVRGLCRFFRERKTLPEGKRRARSPVEMELDQFAEYLRETRGLATATILGHTRRLKLFLGFLRYNQDPCCLRRLELGRIETFLQRSARTNNRFSMQHVVATVRAFLRRQHAQGKLP